MPTATKYTYSIASDFPGGVANTTNLTTEIQASSIVTALDRIDVAGDVIDIWFKDALSAGDKITLDNNTTAPSGGLIATHDNSATTQPTESVLVANKPDVQIRKPDGARAYIFGVDFCEQKTWFSSATAVVDEAVGTGNGIATVFNLDHGSNAVAGETLLDLTRGLVTDDHLMAPPGGSIGGYIPIIKVNGVAQTMREPYESSGGDYEINFDTGVITFYTAPADTLAITASYYYVGADVGPVLKAGPPAGKKWTIDKAEAQITADFATDDWFTDTIVMNVFYAPLEAADPTLEVRYYNIGSLFDYSAGSFVEYPAVVGQRGLSKPTHIFRWEYATPITLLPDYELRAWTAHGRPLGAERATVVMYALEEDI